MEEFKNPKIRTFLIPQSGFAIPQSVLAGGLIIPHSAFAIPH
jgi:hypothetical protein